jgi:hypothetical protein
MRLASALFALLASIGVLGNAVPWMLGTPIRVTALFICATVLFVILSTFLWRLRLWAAVVGLIVASASFVLLAGATFFLWPYARDSLGTPRLALNTLFTMFLPLFVTACICVALGRVLLSNHRLERPVMPKGDAT